MSICIRIAMRGQVLWIGLMAITLLTGCATLDRKEMEEKYPLRAEYSPRWETNETPYDEASRVDKVGRNIRDGFVGIINNFVQAAFSVSTIGPWTGFAVQKFGTMAGDTIGLIDDNEYSEHVFKGVLSRHLLRFGAQAETFTTTMGSIHDTTFEGKEFTTLDYVGDEAFHTRVYGAPSSLATLVCVVASDLLIRPVGNLILIFQGRPAAEKIDKAGLDLIQMGINVPFY